jgi:hypothetical protein
VKKRYISFILISLFCWSCTFEVKLPPTKTSIFDRYPLTLVLYQSHEFKNFKFIFNPTNSFSSSMDIGTPSSLILESTLKSMFDRVLSVDKIPGNIVHYDGILVPKIMGIGGYDRIEIAHSFILYDRNKQIVKEFKITGKDNTGSWRAENGVGPAMQDAMAQLIIMFNDDPQIKDWIASKVDAKQKQPKP